ncbi:MAG: putative Ig domain-containing protein [Dokdonella sp.]
MAARRQQVLGTVITSPIVGPPLTLSANLPFAVIGHAYSGKVWGVGGASGYSYTKAAGPAWVVVDPGNGNVTGNCPSGQASFDLSVTVLDALGTPFTRTFHITTGYTIEPPGGWDTTKTSTPPAVTGQPYQFDVAALLVNPALPVTFTIPAGVAPTGIAFPAPTNGVLTAAAVSGTTQTFSVLATDANGAKTTIPLTITVGDALSVSVFLPQAVLGHDYYGKVTASGGTGVYSYDVRIIGVLLPAWAKFNQSTGEITGRPDALNAVGIGNTIFRVTDSSGVAAQVAAKLLVGSTVTPALPGRVLATAADGSPIDYDALATVLGDGSDGNLVFDGVSNPLPSKVLFTGGRYYATDNIYANNLTLKGACNLNMSIFDMRVRNDTDITLAPAHAINWDGSLLGSVPWWGFAGVAGATGLATGGNTALAGALRAALSGGNGGYNQLFGRGGAGGSSATLGGQSSAPMIGSPIFSLPRMPQQEFAYIDMSAGSTPDLWNLKPLPGGNGGGGGGGGGGNGTVIGGKGGNGGRGAGRGSLYTRRLIKALTTAAKAISATGEDGGVGLAPLSGTNGGGGGGGFGGGGGGLRVFFLLLVGPVIANLLDAGGGAGAAGGNKTAGAQSTVGLGGMGGNGGQILALDLLQGIATYVLGALAGFPAGGQAGVAGGACAVAL